MCSRLRQEISAGDGPRRVANVWDWKETSAAEGGRANLTWGFTDALGGRSSAPYTGLNLGMHVGDDPAAVTANRAMLAADLGLAPDRLLFMDQVHGARVAVVDGPFEKPPQADAMVTTCRGLALAVLVADCVPVLLTDRDAGVVGVAHAGRPGLVAGVAAAVVEAMHDLGARSVSAVVGPSVCGRCYEVPEAMRTEVAAVSPVSASVSWSGTPAVDVAAGVVAALSSQGVSVQWRPGCTKESTRLFSYRRSQVTGRFAGVILQEES